MKWIYLHVYIVNSLDDSAVMSHIKNSGAG